MSKISIELPTLLPAGAEIKACRGKHLLGTLIRRQGRIPAPDSLTSPAGPRWRRGTLSVPSAIAGRKRLAEECLFERAASKRVKVRRSGQPTIGGGSCSAKGRPWSSESSSLRRV